MLDNCEHVKKNQYINSLYWAGLLVGVFLRLRQYITNRSLWADEASLALNIVNRTFSDLLQPLDYDQGAPIGFLFIQKFLLLALGNNELVLRLFPLISGILSVYFIFLISQKLFNGFGLIVLWSFSVSSGMIYYSSELKQYSTDVMVSLLVLYLSLLYLENKSIKNNLRLGITGIIGIFLSHPAAFVLAAAGFLLFLDSWNKKDFLQLRRLLGVGLMWGFAFYLTYLVSLRNLIGSDALQNYWSNNYAPFPPWEHVAWYKNIFVSLLPEMRPSSSHFFALGVKYDYLIAFYLSLLVTGGFSLVFRDIRFAFLVAGPFVLAFIASGLNQYPMSYRFILFWFPSLILLMAQGLKLGYIIISKIHIKGALAIYICVCLVILWTPMVNAYQKMLNPPLGEDIKPVLDYIENNMLNGDEIYIHIGSATPFFYYAPFYKFNANDIFVATKSSTIKRFTVDVEAYRGAERVWFVFSHVVSCDCDATSRAGRIQAYEDVINRYGVQFDKFEASNAVTYLYDFNP